MYTVVIIFLVIQLDYVLLLNKCCDTESYLRQTNSTYICDKDEDKRLQIFTSETNYLYKRNGAQEIKCYDITNTNSRNITEFSIFDETVIKATPIDYNYFSKCCPLGYYYHSRTHSCLPGTNLDVSFITKHFIKVGLPRCELIVDYKLNLDGELHYRLELGALFIGERNIFREGDFCVDKDESNHLIARACHKDLKDVCDEKMCVRKCCPDGQSFVGGKRCVNTYTHGLNLNFSNRINSSEDSFAIVHSYNCDKIYILRDKIDFFMDQRGTLWAYHNLSSRFKDHPVESKTYCIEHLSKGNIYNYTFFVCNYDKPLNLNFLVSRWLKVVSILFILLTMAVYISLPELLNLFGKLLLNFCLAMAVTFAVFGYMKFIRYPSRTECTVLSFIGLYVSLAYAVWLNVMCFNIWSTIGSTKTNFVNQKRSDMKKLIWYCIYGWGFPLVLTVITLFVYLFVDTPEAIKPALGIFKCFWEKKNGNYSVYIFYILPLSVIELVNTVLFAKTIIYCVRVKNEINRLNDNRKSVRERKKVFKADKEQLVLILKLSVTMGIMYVYEVFSTIYNVNLITEGVLWYVEIIWDSFNCLQGVYVFVIFVCKRNVLNLCKVKIFGVKTRKTSLSTQQVSLPLTNAYSPKYQ